ncbi:unnamed protein product [Prunus armeniaca]
MVGPQPHHTLRDLAKKHGPIMHLKLGQLEAVIISSSKAAQEASIAFAPYGDFWRELRKICVFELLSAERVQSFRSIREEEVGNLVESISSVSQQGVAINFTIKLAGGFDIPDLFPSLGFLGYVTGKIPAMKRIRNKLGKILESIISDHMTKRSEDLIASRTTTGIDKAEEEEEDFVDVLLKLQESNKLEFNFTTDRIKDVIMDISAGSETSATTIEWTMSELMRNPRVMKKAQAEVRQVALEGKKNRIEEAEVQKMDYLKSVVKETLRLHPPTPLLPREARERCQISAYELPLKSKVIVNEWALGRDVESWGVDAECFKPERFHGSSVDFKGFDFEFIPLGLEEEYVRA